MQKHLLSKSDLTLKWALEIAQSQEAAAWNTQQLKEGDTSTYLQCGECRCFQQEGGVLPLWRNHSSYREGCFKYAECHNCGRKGHIARGCRSKGAQFKAKSPKKPGNRGKLTRAKWVQANRESDSIEDSLEDSWCARSKTESSNQYSAAAYQWKSIDHGS